MPNKPAAQQQLLAENEDLRLRLAQAEETLREVRSGEVDALFVSGVGGAQLFASTDADQSFRILVERMSEGALTMTAEGVIVYANRRFAGMLKTPLEKVIGSAIRTWIAPDSQPILQSLLETGEGEERRAELVLTASDGTGVPVYLSANNLPINGMSDAYCLVAFDLTEHKRIDAILASERVARELLAAANQSRGELLRVIEEKTLAEKALAQESQRNRLLLRSASDGVHILDADGNVLEVSDSFCQMLGYSREELIGANASRWDAQWSPQELKRKIAELIGTEGRSVFESRHRRRDGCVFDVEISVQRLELNGKPALFESARDITERKQAAQDLRESRQRLDGLVTSAMDAIVTVDEEQRIVLSNPAAERMFGYTAAELQGQRLDLLMPERFRAEHSAHIAVFGKTGVTSRRMGGLRPVSGVRKNGEEFLIEASISKDQSTGRRFFTAILRDITERTRSEERIGRLNRVYAVLSGINTLIVRVRDRDELFREACRIAVETGHFAKAWLGIIDRSSKQFSMVAAHGGDPLFFQNLERELGKRLLAGRGYVARALATRQPTISNDMAGDPEVLLKDDAVAGGVRSMAVLPLVVAGEAVGALTLNSDVPGFFDNEEMKLLVEIAGNIAFAIDHIEKQERLDYLAYYDALTGLANRSLLLERMAQHMRAATSGGHKLAVFLTDLERFRNINDSLGRPAGDELLRQVARWLARVAGDASLVARVGADVFAVVLPVARQGGDLARMLEKMIGSFLEHPFHLNDAIFRIAARGGAAVFPDDGADADTLFKNAEAALKKAKTSGERYLFYTQKMTEGVAGKLTLENQLRKALDNEEFVLHYQPKVNLASGKLTGAEALIRWNDPRTGLVPPGRFIPILEETGMIYEVGRWALKQAIADYLRWRAVGLPAVRIAVNVSALQLRNRGFIAEIEQVIGIDAQAPAGLELEITESLIMEDVKGAIASLQAIRDLGITIAIDDFGTGFSSLSYLARLPVDTLKIDRSFVIDMTVGPEGLAVVSTIINLAHSLKLKVVAEGVEAEEQSRLLRLLACDEMQGFLFSKPLPAEIFEARFLAPPTAK